jgi:hypothetical protein
VAQGVGPEFKPQHCKKKKLGGGIKKTNDGGDEFNYGYILRTVVNVTM